MPVLDPLAEDNIWPAHNTPTRPLKTTTEKIGTGKE
jgi:hypothetical protein